RVFDFAALSSIDQRGGEPRGQRQCRIARLQQNRPAVGAAVPLIELRPQGLGKKIRKQDGLSCDIVAHAKALLSGGKPCSKAFLPRWGLLFFRNSRAVANNAG